MTQKIPRCFGELYNAQVKECQVCKYSMQCWEKMKQKGINHSSVHSGYVLAVITIIAKGKQVTVTDIQTEMLKRFGKEFNIYYYIGVLKKKGLIDVNIAGRQRYYSLR